MSKEQNLYLVHPIYTSTKFRIKTNEEKYLSEKLNHYISNGRTGGGILGRPRVGKTKMIETLMNNLKDRLGNKIPSLRMIASKQDIPTLKNVYFHLLTTNKIQFRPRFIASFLEQKAIALMLDIVNEYNSDKIVLFVDEIQHLNLQQLHVFASIYNFLELIDVQLIVVFFGTPLEVEALKHDAQKDTTFEYVGTRMFSFMEYAKGLMCVADVRYCLNQYDTLRFPNVTGPTYTELFLPNPFERGWRFSDHAELIWQVFLEHEFNESIAEWRMKYFISAMNTLLMDYLPKEGVDKLNSKMVKYAIDDSGNC